MLPLGCPLAEKSKLRNIFYYMAIRIEDAFRALGDKENHYLTKIGKSRLLGRGNVDLRPE